MIIDKWKFFIVHYVMIISYKDLMHICVTHALEYFHTMMTTNMYIMTYHIMYTVILWGSFPSVVLDIKPLVSTSPMRLAHVCVSLPGTLMLIRVSHV